MFFDGNGIICPTLDAVKGVSHAHQPLLDLPAERFIDLQSGIFERYTDLRAIICHNHTHHALHASHTSDDASAGDVFVVHALTR